MKESFTNRQIAFVIFGLVVGYGVLGLPKDVAESAGTGGWFSLLIGTIIAIIFTYIITYLGYVHKDKTLYEYSNTLVGKYVTYIFILIYIINFFMSFTTMIRTASEAIKLSMLINTPVWALSLLFLFVIYYAVIKGFSAIVKLCELYGVIIISGYIIITLAIFTQGKLINLRPFFVAEYIPAYLKGTLVTIFPFTGIEILMIIPFNKNKNNKKIFKYTTLMVGFIGIMYMLIVEACISVMGVDGIIHYKDALFASIRRIDIKSLEFLERIDGIFLIVWIMGIICSISLDFYATVFLISKMAKNIPFNLIAFMIVILSFIVGNMVESMDQVEKIIDYTSYGTLLTGGFIPVVLFLITKVKKDDNKTR